jgi:hypothetical protein
MDNFKRGNSSVVEHNLAKVGVASSNLVSRSNKQIKKPRTIAAFLFRLYGCVAKWLCSGLQSHLCRFDSGRSLHQCIQTDSMKYKNLQVTRLSGFFIVQ